MYILQFRTGIHQKYVESNSSLWRLQKVQSFLNHKFHTILDRYMLRLVDPIYTQLGFNPKTTDTHLQILLRTIAVMFIYAYIYIYIIFTLNYLG